LLTIKPIWNLWQNGVGDWREKIAQYHDNLMHLHGIVIDYGAMIHWNGFQKDPNMCQNSSLKQASPNNIYKC